MENCVEENGVTDSFGTCYICFSNHIWNFISGRILEQLLPKSIYIFFPPVIYYESDIQTEINNTFLKVSDSLWRLYLAADLLSTLHLPSFSICFSTDIVFHQRAATICSGVRYCHPSPEYTTRIMYWFWRGKFEYVSCPYIK